MALRVIADAVAQAVPGLVALGGLRVAADVNAKHRQPAQGRLQRQPVVGLAHINFGQQVGRQRFFRQPAGGAENAVAESAGGIEIAQRELAPGLLAVQGEVAGALRQRTGVTQRAGGLDIAQGREVIPRTAGAAGRQQAQLAEHLALGSRLNAVQRRRDVMHGAEQDLVARRLTGRLRQQAGGGEVQTAALGIIQQGEGCLLNPVMGKGIAVGAERDQLRRYRRMQGIADLRHRHRHHPADHLQLAAAAEAGDAAQQPPGVVRHLLQLLQHQRDHVFGVVPGADGVQIVVPLILIFVVRHQPVIDDAAEKFMHKQRVAAGFFVDQPGQIEGAGRAGMEDVPQPARHRFHRQRLRTQLGGVARGQVQIRQLVMQGAVRQRAGIPVRHHHQQRHGAGVDQQVFQNLQAGGVNPVDIVQQQHQRAARAGEGFHQRQHHVAEARPGVDGEGIAGEARLVIQQQPQLRHQADG